MRASLSALALALATRASRSALALAVAMRELWPALVFALALVIVAVGACGQHDEARFGVVRVAVEDCREPQRGWIVAELDSLAALGPTWRLAGAGETPDVTVRCVAFPDGSQAAARYTAGSNVVEVDPANAPGEFAIRSAAGHDLFHWRVDRGPHPERFVFHVCRFQDEQPPCYAGTFDRNAMMVPSQGVAGGGTGSFDEVDVGTLAQYEPQFSDQRLFLWAIGMAAE